MDEPTFIPPPSRLNGIEGRSKVALIGLDPLTRAGAPWSDPEWEVWGLNGAQRAKDIHRDQDGAFRADLWFQIHPLGFLDRAEREWFHWAATVRVPTYVRPKDLARLQSDDRNSSLLLPFPIDEIREIFPEGIFASTFCLQVALALHLGHFKTIALYGVESRGLGRELAIERPAIAYWVGVARARGVQVQLPANSTWGVYPYVYGFDYLEEATYAAMLTEQVIPQRWLNASESGNLDTVAKVDAAREHTQG